MRLICIRMDNSNSTLAKGYSFRCVSVCPDRRIETRQTGRTHIEILTTACSGLIDIILILSGNIDQHNSKDKCPLRHRLINLLIEQT